MAATVEFSESNGTNAAEVVTDGISNINFGTSDAPNIVPASHPILVGRSSYIKWIRAHVANMGGSANIDTFKIYYGGVLKAQEAIFTNSGSDHTGPTIANGIITTYAHACADTGGGLVVTPFTGQDLTTMLGVGWNNINNFMWSALPTGENIAIGGGAGGVLHAIGYSNYCFLQEYTTVVTPTGPVNQKIITLQWNET